MSLSILELTELMSMTQAVHAGKTLQQLCGNPENWCDLTSDVAFNFLGERISNQIPAVGGGSGNRTQLRVKPEPLTLYFRYRRGLGSFHLTSDPKEEASHYICLHEDGSIVGGPV